MIVFIVSSVGLLRWQSECSYWIATKTIPLKVTFKGCNKLMSEVGYYAWESKCIFFFWYYSWGFQIIIDSFWVGRSCQCVEPRKANTHFSDYVKKGKLVKCYVELETNAKKTGDVCEGEEAKEPLEAGKLFMTDLLTTSKGEQKNLKCIWKNCSNKHIQKRIVHTAFLCSGLWWY